MTQAIVPMFAGTWGVAGLLIGAVEVNRMQKGKPPPGLPPAIVAAILIGEALFGFVIGLLLGTMIWMHQILQGAGQ